MITKSPFSYGRWFHVCVQDFVKQNGNIDSNYVANLIKRAPDKLRGLHELNCFHVSPLADFIQKYKTRSFIETTLYSKRADVILSLPEIRRFVVIEIKTSLKTLNNIEKQFSPIIRQTKRYAKAIKNITGFRAIETIYLSRYGVWICNRRRKGVNTINIIKNPDHLFH